MTPTGRILCLAAVCLLFAFPARPADLRGRVVGITDGDTVTVLVARQPVKVRLAAIDAPEKGQPFHDKSKRALSDLVGGREVRVQVTGKDRYGRTLGLIFRDAIDVNSWMVRNGWAWNYVEYSKDPKLAVAESLARKERRGLWADRRPVAPWDWRRQKKANAPSPASRPTSPRSSRSAQRPAATR